MRVRGLLSASFFVFVLRRAASRAITARQGNFLPCRCRCCRARETRHIHIASCGRAPHGITDHGTEFPQCLCGAMLNKTAGAADQGFWMSISKSRAAKKKWGGSSKVLFRVARACPNESYSRARATVDATPPPAAAALCFHHRRHLRIFSRRCCSRPPPPPLPTPLKLCGPPTGLTNLENSLPCLAHPVVPPTISEPQL
jgi:hypothetical protein